MRLCVDCKHYQAGEQGTMARCGAPQAQFNDPVTGKSAAYFCQIERFSFQGCGESGKWWEPTEAKKELDKAIETEIRSHQEDRLSGDQRECAA